MKYEFRYYKDIEKLSKEKREPKIDVDYIRLLEYDTDTKECYWEWLTDKKAAGKASHENIYKKDFNYKNLNWERLMEARNVALKEVKEWGISYISIYRSRYGNMNCFQWEEVEGD